MKRRDFLATVGGACAASVATGKAEASSSPHAHVKDPLGVLIDATKCIGCRKCEWACNQANSLPVQPLPTFEDKSVFKEMRRPDAGHYTVVNQFEGAPGSDRPLWVKVQCMHCNDPACWSACIVTAFDKHENGAVTYDAWRCMGCRYCMVSCPFQVPAYEYENPLTPQVRKCTFCYERIAKEGGVPACVEICPPQCLIFGKRSQLLELAHNRIGNEPDRYVDHVYGEHEVGGTSWLYLSSVPFAEIGLPTLGTEAPPRLTETIQHGVFKNFVPPLALFAFLGGVMRLFRPEKDKDEQHETVHPGAGKGGKS
jgi:formate dehydrogenase iron-sulfur subunit